MLDILVVLVLLAYTVGGLRQGFVASFMGVCGFAIGGLLGTWVAPTMLGRFGWFEGAPIARGLFVVGVVFLIATVGQALLASLGRAIRPARAGSGARAVDAALGGLAALVMSALLLWFIGDVVRGTGPPVLSQAVSRSVLLRAIDRVVPGSAAEIISGVREYAAAEGFPRVFEGLSPEPILPVEPPSAGVVSGVVVDATTRSVVKVLGAASCNQILEGSGWVVAPNRVVTNAHVVAGVSRPNVQPGGKGKVYPATVVAFDPNRDLAMLSVPGLPSRALTPGTSLGSGDEAVVAGFPEGGDLDLEPARVRSVLHPVGADIYGNPGVQREVYSLYTLVRSGNSGGPLLDAAGHVVGVVFGRSADDADTGYAITLEEAEPFIEAAAGRRAAVDTGACLAR